MTTQFEIDLALMAGASYISTRPDINQFPIPVGWQKVVNPDSYFSDPDTGFEAVSFTNGTEIVISFAGTKDALDAGDNAANFGLASGLGSEQLLQAVEYYLQVRAANPGATITFTGHSLGGGLAALMGVFFGIKAVTFDQAPFANTAEQGLLGTPSYAFDVMTYLIGRTYTDPTMAVVRDTAVLDLSSFLQVQQNIGGIPNSDLVTNICVQGEFLSVAPLTAFDRIGTTTNEILNSSGGVWGFDLHAQSLLTAFLQSDQTAAAGKALDDVTFKLTDLLGMIFNKDLFYNDPNNKNNPQRNFLEHLVRHQAGVRDPATGATTLAADAMVTRFTRDLWKLAQEGGLTMNDGNHLYTSMNNVSKALTAFAMQMYYEDTANATNPNKELFTQITGGLQFDMADVSKTFKTAFDSNGKIDLSKAKGYDLYFKNYLNDLSGILFKPAEQQLIKSLLPTLRDWYVQAGTSGMLASDTLNRGAFMLGGSQGDALVGGTKADLLVGNAGADTLVGGKGNDTLLGGAGLDTYVYTKGSNNTDGFDTILDSGGDGKIFMDGAQLTGGAQYGDDRVHRDSDGRLYVDAGAGLIIDNTMIVLGHSSGNLEINLTGPAANPNPVTTRDIYGDTAPDGTPDDLGNPDGALATGRADTLFDSTGNDHITSYGGDDFIWAYRGGDDIIEAGAGRDIVIDVGGNNVIIGGADADILTGGTGNDRIYAGSQMGTAEAINLGNLKNTGLDQRGDWLSGGAGEDTLIGSAAVDVLMGGQGADLLIGGAGIDFISGDYNWTAASLDWTVTMQNGSPLLPVLDDSAPASGAADVIYAGEDTDWVWGDFGDDVIFGEGGADRLYGGAGNDILIGGEGDDILDGGADTDIYVYNRGDGVDTIRETTSGNILRFGAGINSSGISLKLGSLMLDLGNGDAIHIDNFDPDDANNSSIGRFEFADGSTLTTAELVARGFDIEGTAAADTLSGTSAADRINGKSGDDSLSGGAGDDVYIFNSGDGHDIIAEYDPAAGNVDTIRFGATIAPGDIAFALEGSDLVLNNTVTGDRLTIKDYAFGDAHRIERVEFTPAVPGEAGTVWDAAYLQSQVAALFAGLPVATEGDDNLQIWAGLNSALQGLGGNDTLRGTMGEDTLAGDAGNDILDGGAGADSMAGGAGDDTYMLDNSGDAVAENPGEGIDTVQSSINYTLGANVENLMLTGTTSTGQASAINGTGNVLNNVITGNAAGNTLDGGAGVDTLQGGLGNDKYVFGFGYGHDTVTDTGGIDTIQMADDVKASQVTLSSDGNGNRILTLEGGNDVLTLSNWDAGASNRIEQVMFEDGTVWKLASSGSGVNDTLAGDTGNNTYAFGFDYGQDTVIDMGGIDTVQMAAGVDEADVSLRNDGHGNLIVTLGDGVDTLTLKDWFVRDMYSVPVSRRTCGRGTVGFGAGIAPGDITFTRHDYDLVLSINGTTDQLTLLNWGGGDEYRIERFEFADWPVWGAANDEVFEMRRVG